MPDLVDPNALIAGILDGTDLPRIGQDPQSAPQPLHPLLDEIQRLQAATLGQLGQQLTESRHAPTYSVLERIGAREAELQKRFAAHTGAVVQAMQAAESEPEGSE